MASKRSGRKARSGGGAKAGKRKPGKGSLRDLEAKGARKVHGGGGDLPITKDVDKATVKPF